MYFWAIFVPITAKLLALVETPLPINLLGAHLQLQLSLPFSWIAFFFASVFFSIALLIFQLFAPAIVKDHPSYFHFQSDGKSRYQLKKYGEEVNFGIDEMKQAQEAAGGTEGEELIQQMFWVTSEKAEFYLPKARVSAAIFYLFGFFLMGIVFVQNIVYVSAQI